ncbi:MAG: putative metal-dependent hydrolase [Gemmatimonadales bacterium]|nr:putative metal-dependent hydrolase [Gemmatimonadales bacterium]
MTDLRYPIGPFRFPDPYSAADRERDVDQLAALPARLRAAVAGLADARLDTPYRPDGWTVRQVVHHVPDSHMNAYIRVKLALTESEPTIKPYDEVGWANLPDSGRPIAGSLALTDHLHERWVALLRALPAESFARTCVHPASGSVLSIDKLIAMYAWHGAHHVAHITELRRRQGW